MENKDLIHDMALMLMYLNACETPDDKAVDAGKTVSATTLETLLAEGLVSLEDDGGEKLPTLTENGEQMAHMLVGVYRTALETFKEDLADSLAWKLPQSNLPAFRFRVTLELEGNRPCWRELVVPQHWSFVEFHEAIQSSFLWWGYHLYDFKFRSHGERCMLYDPEQDGIDAMFAYDDEQYTPYDAFSVYLDDVFPRTKRATYTYDYGNGWTHHIEFLESIECYEGEMPACTGGEGDAPPEDVGGPYGYENFLAVVANEDDPGCADARAWALSQFWEPFDLAHVNERMRKWRSEELFDEWDKVHGA